MDDEQYFAAALDADKRQVRTMMSNPGHGLYCGIVDADKATPLAKRLLAPDMFSGWGVRTMSRSALAYNPMSYHNGSVWPHDNALIAAGLKRYRFSRVDESGGDRALRRGDRGRLLPAAGAFLRLHAANAEPAGQLPDRLLAAGVGGGIAVPDAPGDAGTLRRAHENLLTVNLPHLPTG